jgi:TRAP-type C4-dicarboxylate transport system permease small subunit
MKRFTHFLQMTCLDAACVAFLLITILLISFQVFNRYVFHLPVAWTEEMTRYAFVWLILLGSVRGVRDNAHIKVEVFVAMMPPRVQRIFDFVIGIIIMILLLAVMVSGFELLPGAIHRRASTMDISLFYLFISVPLCALLMFGFAVKNTLEILRKVQR